MKCRVYNRDKEVTQLPALLSVSELNNWPTVTCHLQTERSDMTGYRSGCISVILHNNLSTEETLVKLILYAIIVNIPLYLSDVLRGTGVI